MHIPQPHIHKGIVKWQFTIKTSITEIKKFETALRTCPSKKVHVNLLQQVDSEGVDLREKAHQEGDWEAVGKTCFMH